MSMFKKALVAFTAVAASFALASPTLAANPPIEAPPTDVQLTINFDNACLIGGNTVVITVHARSAGKAVAGTVTVTANGGVQATPTPAGFDRLPVIRHTTTTGTIVIKVKTHVVTSIRTFPVTAKFVPDKTKFRHATATRTLTLSPQGSGSKCGVVLPSGGGGLLPNTGGTQAWYLIVGGLLFVGGAGVLAATRRRSKNIF